MFFSHAITSRTHVIANINVYNFTFIEIWIAHTTMISLLIKTNRPFPYIIGYGNFC